MRWTGRAGRGEQSSNPQRPGGVKARGALGLAASPSTPAWFHPQQYTRPSAGRTAHAWAQPRQSGCSRGPGGAAPASAGASTVSAASSPASRSSGPASRRSAGTQTSTPPRETHAEDPGQAPAAQRGVQIEPAHASGGSQPRVSEHDSLTSAHTPSLHSSAPPQSLDVTHSALQRPNKHRSVPHSTSRSHRPPSETRDSQPQEHAANSTTTRLDASVTPPRGVLASRRAAWSVGVVSAGLMSR